jgi:GT2 family glycosyltransferase
MHFSVAALRQAAEGLDHLRQRVRHWSQLAGGERDDTMRQAWSQLFRAELANDLNLPRAYEVLQLATRSRSMPARSKLDLVLEADAVLGLGLGSVARERDDAPAPVLAALAQHTRARESGDYAAADALRARTDGLRLEDHGPEATLVARADRRIARRKRRSIASPRELADRRSDRASRDWTIAVTAREWPEDVERCVRAVLRFAPASAEVLVLDQGSSDRTASRLDSLVSGERVRVIHADRDLGEGAGRNALLRISRGRLLLQLDPSVELVGDLFAPLEAALRSGAGIAGPWGLRTEDLRHFDEVTEGVCDAIELYCQATARDTLLAIGGFDERYRFYRNLDIAVSLAVRERGRRAVAVGIEHAVRHAHRAWEALPEDEREKRSRKNHDRMYRRFRGILASA